MFRNLFENLKRNPILLLLVIVLIFNGPVTALLSGGISGLMNWIMGTLLSLPAIVIAISVHEFAHAFVAVKCGDNTPKYQGRVTLDPRSHIDPMGLLALILIHFGWGNPVRVNYMNFKNRKRDGILVGAAGVFANLCTAFAAGLILKILSIVWPNYYASIIGSTTGSVLVQIVIYNIAFMLFNLLPVPPLDGFGLIVDIFNLRNTKFYSFVLYNSTMILLLFVVLGIPSRLMSMPLSRIVFGILDVVWKVPGWYALAF